MKDSKRQHLNTKRRRGFGVLVGVMLVGLFIAAGQPAVSQTSLYTLTDLGVLPGGVETWGHGINDSGQVTGDNNGPPGAFRWTPAVPNGTSGTMVGLNPIKNLKWSAARAINGSGQVAGMGGATNIPRALMWDANGNAQSIASSSYQSNSYDLNNAGQVVGAMYPSGVRVFLSMVINGKRKLLDLGPGWGVGINSSGWIAGNEVNQAFIWTPTTPNGSSGTRMYLGNFGSYSYAHGINDDEQIVGEAGVTISGLTYGRAFLWLSAPAYGLPAGMNDLGTLPGGYNSAASAINIVGEVVGGADVVVGYDGSGNPILEDHAIIWDNVNGMRDLNGLITSGSGWVLQVATGINSAGQITGTGVLNGAHRAFLLTP